MKKIIALILSFFLLSSVTFAADKEFVLTDKEGTIEVDNSTIFVGENYKNTSIIDLFSKINIDGKDMTDYSLKVLDVRYVNPKWVDFKINSDTDIIDSNSTVYVLFKSKDDGWMVEADKNSTFTFATKNLNLKEIGTVSDLANNSYKAEYDVSYVDKKEEVVNNEPEVENEPVEIVEEEPEEVIDNEIMEENNTGIGDMSLIDTMIIAILAIVVISLLGVEFKNLKRDEYL